MCIIILCLTYEKNKVERNNNPSLEDVNLLHDVFLYRMKVRRCDKCTVNFTKRYNYIARLAKFIGTLLKRIETSV